MLRRSSRLQCFRSSKIVVWDFCRQLNQDRAISFQSRGQSTVYLCRHLCRAHVRIQQRPAAGTVKHELKRAGRHYGSGASADVFHVEQIILGKVFGRPVVLEVNPWLDMCATCKAFAAVVSALDRPAVVVVLQPLEKLCEHKRLAYSGRSQNRQPVWQHVGLSPVADDVGCEPLHCWQHWL